jgi:hypothetical protein
MTETHVISALRIKHAELAGKLIQAEARIVQLQSDLVVQVPAPDRLLGLPVWGNAEQSARRAAVA